jgi:hypothetical protein
MAGRKRSPTNRSSGPSGALVVWLALLVIGVGAATVFVYRSALVSHTGSESPAEAAAKLEARRLQVSVGANDDMRAAQEALLKSGSTAPAGNAAPAAVSGPKAEPAK